MSKRQKNKGSSLTEVLIALLILAEIAAFTIPKVLSSQQEGRKSAVLKETFSMLQSIVYTGVTTGEIVDDGSGYNGNYVLHQVNAIKICHGNSSMLGCWNNTYALPGSSNRGFVLSNGAVVVGAALNQTTNAYHISIDWNGTNSPNVVGEDQLRLVVCYKPDSDCNHGGHLARRTQLVPYQAASQTLFYEIFGN